MGMSLLVVKRNAKDKFEVKQRYVYDEYGNLFGNVVCSIREPTWVPSTLNPTSLASKLAAWAFTQLRLWKCASRVRWIPRNSARKNVQND
jgi:hypothetical protein